MGLPASIASGFQGTAKAFQASLTNAPLLILAALVTVYIVLGVLYTPVIYLYLDRFRLWCARRRQPITPAAVPEVSRRGVEVGD